MYIYTKYNGVFTRLLALNYYIDDENFRCRAAEMELDHLARPRIVSVDLKYDILC